MRSHEDVLRKYHDMIADLAIQRLGRPLSKGELLGLREVKSLMLLEALEPHITDAPLSELERILGRLPEVESAAAVLSEEGTVRCSTCQKELAKFGPETDGMNPKPEELLNAGGVPVPNFGWFCSQDCGNQYERNHSVRFHRNHDGCIQYYDES
jgi:hypothetical protein